MFGSVRCSGQSGDWVRPFPGDAEPPDNSHASIPGSGEGQVLKEGFDADRRRFHSLGPLGIVWGAYSLCFCFIRQHPRAQDS